MLQTLKLNNKNLKNEERRTQIFTGLTTDVNLLLLKVERSGSKFTKLFKENSKDYQNFQRHLRTKYRKIIDILFVFIVGKINL